MRKIKFRGIEIDTGDFVYGYLMHSEQEDTYYIGTAELMTPVKSDTVGQFTGVFDKHGVEVYEGDIVRVIRDSQFVGKCTAIEEIVFIGYINQLAKYHAIGAVFDNLFEFMFGTTDNNKGEIIGNIYQNANLLYECPQNT